MEKQRRYESKRSTSGKEPFSIIRTLVEHNGRVDFDAPKTAAGNRTLALPKELVNELVQHLELMELDAPTDLLFADAFGGPLRLVLRLYAHALTDADRRAADRTSDIYWSAGRSDV